MATPAQIETMRELVMDEQRSAAFDQRQPNCGLLNDLASEILRVETPVMCAPTELLYRRILPDGHVDQQLPARKEVSGRFGGFVLASSQVHYLLLNTELTDRGFMCPVGTTPILDVEDAIADDALFGELAMKMGEFFGGESHGIETFISLIAKAPKEKKQKYAVYFASMLFPANFYDAVYTYGTLRELPSSPGTAKYCLQKSLSRYGVRATDTFTFLQIPKVAKDVIALSLGEDPTIYIPVAWVQGAEHVEQVQDNDEQE